MAFIPIRDRHTTGSVEQGYNLNLVEGKGVLVNLQYASKLTLLGFAAFTYSGESIAKGFLQLNVNLPDNFIIKEAKVKISVFKTKNYFFGDEFGAYGKVQNIRLYKGGDIEYINGNNEIFTNEGVYSEIDGAFGVSGFTTITIEGDVAYSLDVANYLDAGSNSLIVQTDDPIPTGDFQEMIDIAQGQTQIASCVIDIIGYKNYN